MREPNEGGGCYWPSSLLLSSYITGVIPISHHTESPVTFGKWKMQCIQLVASIHTIHERIRKVNLIYRTFCTHIHTHTSIYMTIHIHPYMHTSRCIHILYMCIGRLIIMLLKSLTDKATSSAAQQTCSLRHLRRAVPSPARAPPVSSPACSPARRKRSDRGSRQSATRRRRQNEIGCISQWKKKL